MEIPRRKNNRLEGFDYSSSGAYFITICTKDMKRVFSRIVPPKTNVGETCGLPPQVELTAYGKIVENEIKVFKNTYENMYIMSYVIMPNHIHMIIVIDNNGRPQVSPTISRAIKQFKGAITKKIGKSIWQTSFYDHIIRNEEDMYYHLQYIDENPKKRLLGKDEYYS